MTCVNKKKKASKYIFLKLHWTHAPMLTAEALTTVHYWSNLAPDLHRTEAVTTYSLFPFQNTGRSKQLATPLI